MTSTEQQCKQVRGDTECTQRSWGPRLKWGQRVGVFGNFRFERTAAWKVRQTPNHLFHNLCCSLTTFLPGSCMAVMRVTPSMLQPHHPTATTTDKYAITVPLLFLEYANMYTCPASSRVECSLKTHILRLKYLHTPSTFAVDMQIQYTQTHR